MMRIDAVSGRNTRTGMMGMAQANDSESRNIQNQIANAQQKLKDLSSNEELSLEEKRKKRQEIQQEIANLKQQLRQHQMELRKEQQSKKSSSMEDMVAGVKTTSIKKGEGLSQAGMQSMISADSSMKQAKVQGGVVAQIKGWAGVLESEIRQDAGKGNTEKKEVELADLRAKAQSATEAQMSALAEADKSAEEVSRADDTTETKKDKTEKTQKNADITAESTDAAEDTGVKAEKETTTKIENLASEGRQTVYTPIDIRL